MANFLTDGDPKLRRDTLILCRNLSLSTVPKVWDHLVKKGLPELLLPIIQDASVTLEEKGAAMVTIARIADFNENMLAALGQWARQADSPISKFAAAYGFHTLALKNSAELSRRVPDLVSILTPIANATKSQNDHEIYAAKEAAAVISSVSSSSDSITSASRFASSSTPALRLPTAGPPIPGRPAPSVPPRTGSSVPRSQTVVEGRFSANTSVSASPMPSPPRSPRRVESVTHLPFANDNKLPALQVPGYYQHRNMYLLYC